jgi:DNA-binding transcriptional LysR family regulator
MRDLQTLRLFLAVARTRNFSEAARQFGLTPASVTRAISALEAELGLQLFARTTRQVTPTSDGAAFVARIEPFVQGLDTALAETSSGPEGEGGNLSLSVPLTFGIRVLQPVLSEFLHRYPRIGLKIDMTDTLVDLSAREYDMAIRISALPETGSTLQRKIARIERRLVAAPGAPEVGATDPSALDPARCLGHCPPGKTEVWRLANEGATRRVVAGQWMAVNNGDMLARMASEGIGVAQLPDFLIRDDLEAGRLVPVLPGWTCEGIWLSLAYPPYGRLPPLVALFSQFIEARLGVPTF